MLLHLTSPQLATLDTFNARHDASWHITAVENGVLFVNIPSPKWDVERKIDTEGKIWAWDEGEAFEWVPATAEVFTDEDGCHW